MAKQAKRKRQTVRPKARSLLGNAKRESRRGKVRSGVKAESGFGRDRDQNDRGPERGYY
jgi:hypothetical protein